MRPKTLFNGTDDADTTYKLTTKEELPGLGMGSNALQERKGIADAVGYVRS